MVGRHSAPFRQFKYGFEIFQLLLKFSYVSVAAVKAIKVRLPPRQDITDGRPIVYY